MFCKASQTLHAVERPTTSSMFSSVREESSRLRRCWSVAFHAKEGEGGGGTMVDQHSLIILGSQEGEGVGSSIGHSWWMTG